MPTNEVLLVVASLPSLKKLSTPAFVTSTNDNGIGNLVQNLSNLETLKFTWLETSFAVPSPGFPNLKELILPKPRVDAGIESLEFLPLLKKLTINGLRVCDGEIALFAAGIETLPSGAGVFVDIEARGYWYKDNADKTLTSGWFVACVKPLIELLENAHRRGATTTDMRVEINTHPEQHIYVKTTENPLDLLNMQMYAQMYG